MDYLSYFNLRSEPFSHAPLSRFYYASAQHTDALKRLFYSANSMKGLALLVGDIGRGKTTLARRLLDMLPEDEFEAAMLVIVHSGVTAGWLLKRIAVQLGVRDPAEDKLAVLAQLYERLIEIHHSGRRAVVLIDEAQMLSTRDLMEEFRGLLNLEVPGQKLITFVFFGLPEIERNLQLDPPLAQRVALRCHLKPLGLADTQAYVAHRLRLAGGSSDSFPPASLAAVHRLSGGVPRLINVLCDNVLLELYFARRRQAGPEFVENVAKNLGLREGGGDEAAHGDSDGTAGEISAPSVDDEAAEAESAAEHVLGVSPGALAAQVAAEEVLTEVDDTVPGGEDMLSGPSVAPTTEPEMEAVGAPTEVVFSALVVGADEREVVGTAPGPLEPAAGDAAPASADESVMLPGDDWRGVQPASAILGGQTAWSRDDTVVGSAEELRQALSDEVGRSASAPIADVLGGAGKSPGVFESDEIEPDEIEVTEDVVVMEEDMASVSSPSVEVALLASTQVAAAGARTEPVTGRLAALEDGDNDPIPLPEYTPAAARAEAASLSAKGQRAASGKSPIKTSDGKTLDLGAIDSLLADIE